MDDVISWTTEVLRHPVLLALVTAFLVNGVTRRWQDRQKTLEVTTGLVSAMSDATTAALLAANRAHVLLPRGALRPETTTELRPPSPSGEERRKHVDELRAAHETWERDSAVLGTKLEAYFPTRRAQQKRLPPIASRWTAFSDRVSRAMAVTVDGVLREVPGNGWPAERDELLSVKAELIRLVLDEQPAGFARSLSWRGFWRHRPHVGRRRPAVANGATAPVP